MKVFISWSGERSKAVAGALREWLPLVLQYVEPWVSDQDIAAGDRWALSIADELENSNFGIICVTPENVTSDWVHFEAGALSKSMLDSKVIPLLFDLDLSDLGGPLSQFQAHKADEEGVTAIIKAINSVSDNKAAEEIVAKLVPTLWPDLEQALNKIQDKSPVGKHARKQSEILEDLVSSVRGLNSRMNELSSEATEVDERRLPPTRRTPPLRAIERIILEMSKHRIGQPMILPVLAGLLESRWPWLSNHLLAIHARALKANPNDLFAIQREAVLSVDFLINGPVSDFLLGRARDSEFIKLELLPLLDIAMRQYADFDAENGMPFEDLGLPDKG